MLFELRSYDLKVGQALSYLETFRTNGLEFVTRHLPLAGYWLTDTGKLNRIHHMWIYASLEERAACRAGLSTDLDWNEKFVPSAFPSIVTQQNAMLRLSASSPLLDSVVANRRDHHTNQLTSQPMFSEVGLSMTLGEVDETQDCIGQWTVISGERPGTRVSLFRHSSTDPLSSSAGSSRHEVLRALSCSPLK